jgi:hypothetical protein
MFKIKPNNAGYSIDKGFPAPTKMGKFDHELIIKTILEMDFGDSIVVSSQNEADAFRREFFKHKMGYVTRKQADGTYRVWKIKKTAPL